MSRKDEIEIHTNDWVLRLDTASGQSGYYEAVGSDGIFLSPNATGRVCRFKSREDANRHALWLAKQGFINDEEATPEEIVHEKVKSLWLGDSECPDGMSVELDEKSGKRYLLLRDDREEISCDEFDDNFADMLVRILDKLETCLHRSVKK
jgi:hypothetical protein